LAVMRTTGCRAWRLSMGRIGLWNCTAHSSAAQAAERVELVVPAHAAMSHGSAQAIIKHL
jgi:hypothetical protein